MLEISRDLVSEFISDLYAEGSTIWKITSKRGFLGYTSTSSQMYYWCMDTNLGKKEFTV